MANTNTAVVTGATGYCATEIVSQLLQKGYTVRATVRDAKDTIKTAHLRQLADVYPGELTFHEAKLGEPGSFNEVIKGCTYVFHTAGPTDMATFPKDLPGRQRLVDEAVQSQLDIIQAAAASKDTIKKIVITSSSAALKPFEAWRMEPWNEEDWNDEASLEKDTYLYIKTLTERKAFKMAEELGLGVVTILPTFVTGPVISDALSFSPACVKHWLESQFPTSWLATAVDVRDVARAHIAAAERPEASGRYLVANERTCPVQRLIKALKERIPENGIDEAAYTDVAPFIPDFRVFDTSKAQTDLGLNFMDVPESFCDMVVSMVKKGMLKIP